LYDQPSALRSRQLPYRPSIAVQTIIAEAAKTNLQILKKAAAIVQIEPPARPQKTQ
jgi:hypothetical protein